MLLLCLCCFIQPTSPHLFLSCFGTVDNQSECSNSARLGYVAAPATERWDRSLPSGRSDNTIKQKYFHYWTEAWLGLECGESVNN